MRRTIPSQSRPCSKSGGGTRRNVPIAKRGAITSTAVALSGPTASSMTNDSAVPSRLEIFGERRSASLKWSGRTAGRRNQSLSCRILSSGQRRVGSCHSPEISACGIGLRDFALARNASNLDDITFELLDQFRSGRTISQLTWSKEFPIIRQFFAHCMDRAWANENTARRLKVSRNAKPKAVDPYTPEELARIIAASSAIGRGSYERLRARAMTLVFRYTALRISDVAVLKKARVNLGEVFRRAEKNGKPVRLPVPADLQHTLTNCHDRRQLRTNAPTSFGAGTGPKKARSGTFAEP
jgi:hypothetical protein